jgi:intron-binding protein aquarius
MAANKWREAPNDEVLAVVSQTSYWLDSPDFSELFRRVLALNLDISLPLSSRIAALSAVQAAFRSIEKPHIRKSCASIVGISIWQNIQSDRRDKLFEESATLKKAWRASEKRYQAADPQAQADARIHNSWLFSMVADFLGHVNNTSATSAEEILYCQRFLEFMTDLASTLPTSRYTNQLFQDLSVVPIIRQSHRRDQLSDLADLLHHFLTFSRTPESHYAAVFFLQKTALKHFSQSLKVLGLSNIGVIDLELDSHFTSLSDNELRRLCNLLTIRTTWPKTADTEPSRDILIEILTTTYQRPQDFRDVVARLPILPTEESLHDPAALENEAYDGSKPLAMPKLNLQYLSMNDFMWRSFQLHRAEALFEIRKDMELTVKKLKAKTSQTQKIEFTGFSRMAIPIDKPAIIEVGQARVGSTTPAFVRAEVILDVSRLTENIRKDWDDLRPGDVVYLLAVKAPLSRTLTNGHANGYSKKDQDIAYLRCAEVVQVLDESGRALREIQNGQANGFGQRTRRRRLLINIDAFAYKRDLNRLAAGKSDIYASVNVIARRQGRENNFKPILETIQKLVRSGTELPEWLQDVYLGFGDPRAVVPESLDTRLDSVDFRGTFLNWEHLIESFADRKIISDIGPIDPPYILQTSGQISAKHPSNPKKRRREQMEQEEPATNLVRVSTYKPPNNGPYPADAPRVNTVRFTPTQIQAIESGTQPGMTLVVGPPGTGKTDVAVQTINLLYHNFPDERILLVAHSNQALNQLFQKIIALDIDSRHLLRLGHGEEDLESDSSYSKYGRVESFLENRQAYLSEVNRLAASIGAEGAHGNSCETADYFNQVYIEPAWRRFWEAVKTTPKAFIDAFPFNTFFANAPIPELFPATSSIEELERIAQGCEAHITKLFTELAAIRPFELLRHSRDQQNHLLVTEARIIAMTSTHAAMRRAEIAELGFHYSTLIMEEAAQITEIESFIPMAMQNPDTRTGELPLKRVMLIGDHLQNSPIVQNLALREYANLEQSLFLRLVRLGVPTITLDQQGRCRPSIAQLFSWRYEKLGNLPHLLTTAEFSHANAGFQYDYQFIDVPDYQGQGEREPSPHFIQNLGEAEYAVALFQYMRLLGYPAKSITILATYAGQRALIKDVLDHRCKGNKLFGLPKHVSTVDKYQGEQNDYVILSMTRTKSIGYLHDVRRLTVALSRARLGLYVLGRKQLFQEQCSELSPAMTLFDQHSSQLSLVTGEMYPTQRGLDNDVAGKVAEMAGVEHIGQYVFEMTQAKIAVMGGSVRVADAMNGGEEVLEEDDIVEEVEEDPLHEF